MCLCHIQTQPDGMTSPLSIRCYCFEVPKSSLTPRKVHTWKLFGPYYFSDSILKAKLSQLELNITRLSECSSLPTQQNEPQAGRSGYCIKKILAFYIILHLFLVAVSLSTRVDLQASAILVRYWTHPISRTKTTYTNNLMTRGLRRYLTFHMTSVVAREVHNDTTLHIIPP